MVEFHSYVNNIFDNIKADKMKLLNNNRIVSNVKVSNVNDLNNYELCALWDTGCVGTVINEKKINQIGLIKTGRKQKISTLNKNSECDVYEIELLLENHTKSIKIEAVGMDLTNKNCDIILGMDIIKNGDFIFRTPNDFEFNIISLI